MAVDKAALVRRAAELLTDEEYDFWDEAFHQRSVDEAICVVLVAAKSQMETDCVFVSFTTEAGATQVLPEDLDGRFLGVVSNASGRTIREYDRDKLDNLMPCWAEKTGDWRGYAEFWTEGGCNDGSFMLYPPPPAGHEIRVKLERDPAEQSADDLGCEYNSPILDYMLWRAHIRQGSENTEWQAHRASFWDHMRVYKTADQERILREAGCYDKLCKDRDERHGGMA